MGQFLVTGCGVSPLLRDRWGFTPLVEAARFHHTPLVELLLEHVRQKMGQAEYEQSREVVARLQEKERTRQLATPAQ